MPSPVMVLCAEAEWLVVECSVVIRSIRVGTILLSKFVYNGVNL